jgi:hypothetical protein
MADVPNGCAHEFGQGRRDADWGMAYVCAKCGVYESAAYVVRHLELQLAAAREKARTAEEEAARHKAYGVSQHGLVEHWIRAFKQTLDERDETRKKLAARDAEVERMRVLAANLCKAISDDDDHEIDAATTRAAVALVVAISPDGRVNAVATPPTHTQDRGGREERDPKYGPYCPDCGCGMGGHRVAHYGAPITCAPAQPEPAPGRGGDFQHEPSCPRLWDLTKACTCLASSDQPEPAPSDGVRPAPYTITPLSKPPEPVWVDAPPGMATPDGGVPVPAGAMSEPAPVARVQHKPDCPTERIGSYDVYTCDCADAAGIGKAPPPPDAKAPRCTFCSCPADNLFCSCTCHLAPDAKAAPDKTSSEAGGTAAKRQRSQTLTPAEGSEEPAPISPETPNWHRTMPERLNLKNSWSGGYVSCNGFGLEYVRSDLHTAAIARAEALEKALTVLIIRSEHVAHDQPAAHSKTQPEADRWALFYSAINDARALLDPAPK